jgi:hypothetical protein
MWSHFNFVTISVLLNSFLRRFIMYWLHCTPFIIRFFWCSQ